MKAKIIAALALALAGSAYAADKPCSAADASNAEKAIDRVMSWPQLQKAYVDYKHCDKDAVADVYSDALLRLAVEWKNIDALSAAMKDAGFKEFVNSHLRAATKEDKEAIYSRTRSHCPKGQDAFCADLALVVHEERAKPLEMMKPMEMMPTQPAKPGTK